MADAGAVRHTGAGIARRQAFHERQRAEREELEVQGAAQLPAETSSMLSVRAIDMLDKVAEVGPNYFVLKSKESKKARRKRNCNCQECEDHGVNQPLNENMSDSHLIQFPRLFKGSASMYSKSVPPIQRVFEASGRIEVHATITKDVRRVSLSRQANRQCTLHQFEALT